MSGDPVIATAEVQWRRAARIILSLHLPIDLFEDIADPADWHLLASAEQKTNPRLMETLGNLDLIPATRRVGGPGASYVMAPFAHFSPDRPSRFSNGTFGVLYVGRTFETALFETMHHHALFMAATAQPAGWTSQFREIVLDVDAVLTDIRTDTANPVLVLDNYAPGQALGSRLRAAGLQGVVFLSVRHPGGECAGLFYPDLASRPTQGRHLDYHWNSRRVDFYRNAGTRQVFRITEPSAVATGPQACG